MGSKNSLKPWGIPLTVSQEYPPSGSRKGRWRSRLSSSWTSRPSLPIRLSAEASAAVTTASIKSCSGDDKWMRRRIHFRKRSFSCMDWHLSFWDKASGKRTFNLPAVFFNKTLRWPHRDEKVKFKKVFIYLFKPISRAILASCIFLHFILYVAVSYFITIVLFLTCLTLYIGLLSNFFHILYYFINYLF